MPWRHQRLNHSFINIEFNLKSCPRMKSMHFVCMLTANCSKWLHISMHIRAELMFMCRATSVSYHFLRGPSDKWEKEELSYVVLLLRRYRLWSMGIKKRGEKEEGTSDLVSWRDVHHVQRSLQPESLHSRLQHHHISIAWSFCPRTSTQSAIIITILSSCLPDLAHILVMCGPKRLMRMLHIDGA